jgi:hypothetical protein
MHLSHAHDIPQHHDFLPTIIHPTTLSHKPPLNTIGIYIDGFIGLAQQPYMQYTLCTLLHSIDSIFGATLTWMTGQIGKPLYLPLNCRPVMVHGVLPKLCSGSF